VTHTKGKSLRFTADSPAYQRLKGIKHYSGRLLALRVEASAANFVRRLAGWVRRKLL
jgi:hypothetical protein